MGNGVSIKIPEINLPSVPEFLASILRFFLYLYPSTPTPYILQSFPSTTTFTPNFSTACKDAVSYTHLRAHET